MQRFLADENIPPASVGRLRAAGHDVAAIREDAPGLDDPLVFARAVDEQRILLTSDRDHGELIFLYAHPAPPGVVYFRLASEDQEELATWLLRWLAEEDRPLEGWFTVVRAGKVRRRPLRP